MDRFDAARFSDSLKQLQERKRLTNKDLAQRTGVDERTIERWRAGGIKRQPKQEDLDRLAKVLDVEPAVLLGKAAMPEVEPRESSTRLLADLGFKSVPVLLRPSQRNTLALIASRYGVTPTFVFELAPLLFDIVARRSLRARSEAIGEIGRRQAALRAMQARSPHLPELTTAPHHAQDEALAAEERSIGAYDLFAETVRADKSLEDYWLGEEFDQPNPFQAYLAGLAEEAGCDAQIEKIERNQEPRFSILRDEALRVAGGDEELADDILGGIILLSSLPKELRADDRVEDRVRWLHQERERVRASAAERFGGLLSGLDADGPAAAEEGR